MNKKRMSNDFSIDELKKRGRKRVRLQSVTSVKISVSRVQTGWRINEVVLIRVEKRHSRPMFFFAVSLVFSVQTNLFDTSPKLRPFFVLLNRSERERRRAPRCTRSSSPYFCSSNRTAFKMSSHNFLLISMKFRSKLYVMVMMLVFQCVFEIRQSGGKRIGRISSRFSSINWTTYSFDQRARARSATLSETEERLMGANSPSRSTYLKVCRRPGTADLFEERNTDTLEHGRIDHVENLF